MTLTRFFPRFRLASLAFAGLWASVLAACARDGGAVTEFRGVMLNTPLDKPSFTLTDVNGHPFDFRAATEGKVGLLFFGYTHCPDICPLHMANIAAVLRQMPHEERSRVVTVFVTTDPERDTPERLREWLGKFDPSFVGLTGTPDEIARVQELFGLRQAFREYLPNADSANYYVAHAAQVYAFAQDGKAYLVYPFGIRQEDWANDLPRLARDVTGEQVRRAHAASSQTAAAEPGQPARIEPPPRQPLAVTQAVVAEPAAGTEAALYLTIRNETSRADTLVAVATDLAARAEIHETMGTGEMRHMMAIASVPIPAGQETRLAPGARHVMLFDLRRPLQAGDTVRVYVSLSGHGALQARAPVVPYADLERVLSAQGAEHR